MGYLNKDECDADDLGAKRFTRVRRVAFFPFSPPPSPPPHGRETTDGGERHVEPDADVLSVSGPDARRARGEGGGGGAALRIRVKSGVRVSLPA